MDWWRTGYRQTGLMKVPFVQAPDGRWLQDSTPMILWFEQRYPEHSILPEDPNLRQRNDIAKCCRFSRTNAQVLSI